MRATIAVEKAARVNAGKTRWAGVPIPPAGSQCRCTANSSMSMIPSQKTGTDTPPSATIITE